MTDVTRCPAAHHDDPTPCDGPPVVTVLDATGAGADGCEHHGARLLASLEGGRVYALPDAPEGRRDPRVQGGRQHPAVRLVRQRAAHQALTAQQPREPRAVLTHHGAG